MSREYYSRVLRDNADQTIELELCEIHVHWLAGSSVMLIASCWARLRDGCNQRGRRMTESDAGMEDHVCDGLGDGKYVGRICGGCCEKITVTF